MINTCMQSLRRVSLWISLPCMLILALAVTACGGGSSTSGSATPATTPASQTTTSGSAATPSGAASIMINEKTGGHDVYTFSPKTLTVKAGTAVVWVNNSDENHLLTCTPADVTTAQSIVHKSGSPDNTYQQMFPKAGKYTCTSQLVQRANNQPENAPSDAKVTIKVTA